MAKGKRIYDSPIIRLMFLLYIGLMVWLLFIQRIDAGGRSIDENWNFTPFKTLKLYWHLVFSENSYYVVHSVINLVGNVIMFVPLGIFLPLIWSRFRNFWQILLFSIVLIILIEFTQLFTGLGSCDVDDLILNLPGIIIGFLSLNGRLKNRQ